MNDIKAVEEIAKGNWERNRILCEEHAKASENLTQALFVQSRMPSLEADVMVEVAMARLARAESRLLGAL